MRKHRIFITAIMGGFLLEEIWNLQQENYII